MAPRPLTDHITIHATTVALNGRAVVITGASGSGKSSLGLNLMALGCELVADDRTILSGGPDGLMANCPPTISGRIEARGIGILNAAPVSAAKVVMLIDLDRQQTERLPESETRSFLGYDVPVFKVAQNGAFPAAILQYLKHGQGG